MTASDSSSKKQPDRCPIGINTLSLLGQKRYRICVARYICVLRVWLPTDQSLLVRRMPICQQQRLDLSAKIYSVIRVFLHILRRFRPKRTIVKSQPPSVTLEKRSLSNAVYPS